MSAMNDFGRRSLSNYQAVQEAFSQQRKKVKKLLVYVSSAKDKTQQGMTNRLARTRGFVVSNRLHTRMFYW